MISLPVVNPLGYRKMKLLQITSPYFTAGAELEDGWVIRAAPIIKYMIDWHITKLLRYATQKGWKVEEVKC